METNTVMENDGIAEMRRLVKEFLKSGEGSSKVREYISSVTQDDTLLRIFLKGRKYRANYAWKTLKRNAEIRFDKYPEVFPQETPDGIFGLSNDGVGILKSRDKIGRRIACLNAEKWDPDQWTMEQLTAFGVYFLDKALFDEDFLTNGVIIVQNCNGIGYKHAKMYTLSAILRLLDVVWNAYPFKLEAVYFVNVPFYFFYPYKPIQPFFSKKLKERIIISRKDKPFEALHQKLSPKLLPKHLGGDKETETAFDLDFLQPMKQETM